MLENILDSHQLSLANSSRLPDHREPERSALIQHPMHHAYFTNQAVGYKEGYKVLRQDVCLRRPTVPILLYRRIGKYLTPANLGG